MLYLIAKEAAEKKHDCKILVDHVHRIFAGFEGELERLGVQVLFTRNPVDVYSKQVEEAIDELVPFDLEIVNPSFSVRLPHENAAVRLRHAKKDLPPATIGKLESLYAQFSESLAAQAE